MALSRKQIQNRVRLIVVAEYSKAFKKAKIVERVIERAKQQNRVAAGNLINPEKSESIIPSRDDLFLTKVKSAKFKLKARVPVSVRIYKVYKEMIVDLRIKIQVPGSLSPQYVQISSISSKNLTRSWFPSESGIDSIKNWIKQKMSRGVTFDVPKSSNNKNRGKLSPNDEINISRLAFGIANKINERGIKTKTDLDKPFNEISSVMNKAKVITENRVKLLMVEQSIPLMQNALFDVFTENK